MGPLFKKVIYSVVISTMLSCLYIPLNVWQHYSLVIFYPLIFLLVLVYLSMIQRGMLRSFGSVLVSSVTISIMITSSIIFVLIDPAGNAGYTFTDHTIVLLWLSFIAVCISFILLSVIFTIPGLLSKK